MSRIGTVLAKEYAAAMRHYLAGEGEAALQRAYEVGRRALAEGMGVLEMAAAHQKALVLAIRSQADPRDKEKVLECAWSCFAESLSPFEMVLRGVQDANARLQDSLSGVQRVEEQLRQQNAELIAAHGTVDKERSRYQALFDFAPDGYLVTGMEGAILEANAAAAAILRTPKELLPGQSLYEYVARADREDFRERLHALHRGSIERVEDWEFYIQPRDGPPIPGALTVVAERSVPSVSSLRWLIRDATERKRLEKERAQWLVSRAKAHAAQRFEFLAAASSVLVGSLDAEASLIRVAHLATSFPADWCFMSVVDPGGALRQLEVVHVDPSAADLASQLRGHCLFGGPSPRNRGYLLSGPAVSEPLTAAWCDRAADSADHAELLRRIQGSSAMVLPMLIRDRLVGVLTLISAVTARHYRRVDRVLGEDLARRCALAIENGRLYREVVTERDKVERASRAKDEFVAILGHEIRNPLTSILGWTRLLRKNTVISSEPVLAEGVRAMERSAITLTRLVGECIDLTKISEGKIQIEETHVDLNQVVRLAVDAVREMAVERGLRLSTELCVNAPPVLGDAMRLDQVVMNLLVNAVKYTDRGGLISIRTLWIGQDMEIEVSDTGIGIDPAFLEQIFEPFRQGTTSWLTSQSGLGLGLAIVRKIVAMHGGRVWAESPGLGHGSTFRVRLQVADGTNQPSRIETVAETPSAQGQSLRILLVEDSADILFLMRVELERLGHTVFTATNGQLGEEAALKQSPDLIISDIKMPVVDGYELLRRLRQVPQLSRIPAIALTGFGSKADVERALAAGFTACLSKPEAFSEVAVLIRQLTENSTHVL